MKRWKERISEYMERNWFAACIVALLLGVPALAQVFTAPNNFTLLGHYIAAGNPPTTANCTLAAGSTDTDGSCTATSGAPTITFSQVYLTAPNCIAQDSSATPAVVYTTSTTALTITGTTAHVYFWHCAGKIGG